MRTSEDVWSDIYLKDKAYNCDELKHSMLKAQLYGSADRVEQLLEDTRYTHLVNLNFLLKHINWSMGVNPKDMYRSVRR